MEIEYQRSIAWVLYRNGFTQRSRRAAWEIREMGSEVDQTGERASRNEGSSSFWPSPRNRRRHSRTNRKFIRRQVCRESQKSKKEAVSKWNWYWPIYDSSNCPIKRKKIQKTTKKAFTDRQTQRRETKICKRKEKELWSLQTICLLWRVVIPNFCHSNGAVGWWGRTAWDQTKNWLQGLSVGRL